MTDMLADNKKFMVDGKWTTWLKERVLQDGQAAEEKNKITLEFSTPKPHRKVVKCKIDGDDRLMCRSYQPGPTHGCKFICGKEYCAAMAQSNV